MVKWRTACCIRGRDHCPKDIDINKLRTRKIELERDIGVYSNDRNAPYKRARQISRRRRTVPFVPLNNEFHGQVDDNLDKI